MSDCTCHADILRRIAEASPATPWPLHEELEPDDVASYLDVPFEVMPLLCETGLIAARQTGTMERPEWRIPASELLRFVQAHGGWWFQVRSERQRERLERYVARGTVHDA